MSDEVENKQKTSTLKLKDLDIDCKAVDEDTANIGNEGKLTNETDNCNESPHIVDLGTSAQNIENKVIFPNQSNLLKTNETTEKDLINTNDAPLPQIIQVNKSHYKVTCSITKGNDTKQQEPFGFSVNVDDGNEITAILHSVKSAATSLLIGINDDVISLQDGSSTSGLAATIDSPQNNQSEDELNSKKNFETARHTVEKPNIILTELQTAQQRSDWLKNSSINIFNADSKGEVHMAQGNDKADNVYVKVDPTELGFRLTIYNAESPPGDTSADTNVQQPQQTEEEPSTPLLRMDVEVVLEADPPIVSCEENQNKTINQEAEKEPESVKESDESNGNHF